jgi:hypothetical protein
MLNLICSVEALAKTSFAPDRFTTILPTMEMTEAPKASPFQGNNGFKPVAGSGRSHFIGPWVRDEGLKVCLTARFRDGARVAGGLNQPRCNSGGNAAHSWIAWGGNQAGPTLRGGGDQPLPRRPLRHESWQYKSFGILHLGVVVVEVVPCLLE